jgi:hypothetical protein
MVLREFKASRIYQGSLDKGADIVEGLSAVMKQQHIEAGMISGIGAVSEARLAYFNAQTKLYEEKHFKENMEIVSLKGNISFKDNSLFTHLHAVLSNKDFATVGGHLLPKTYVYAFEFEIIPFEGKSFVRGFDEETGLFLWEK